MQENEKLLNAIEAANQYGRFFCKFLSGNDTGINGTHQDGIYLAKSAWNIFFPDYLKIPRGINMERYIKIYIDGFCAFDSRIVYYGQGTRNEYRITQFWSNSPFDKSKHVGDLVVFVPISTQDFKVYLFNTEEAIEGFIEEFSLSLVKNTATYHKGPGQELEINRTLEEIMKEEFDLFEDFPNTTLMAEKSRNYYNTYNRIRAIEPDKHLLKWIETEYSLFKMTENKMYAHYLTTPFNDLDPLISFANSAINRRKSRAGKSLELHVDFIFKNIPIPFAYPGITEGNKKPDFLLPSNAAYANLQYNADKLTFLGTKTTCKDRWRQILNEADRIPQKHLLTLQQGITANQLDEMKIENVTLVVPASYHKLYPETHQDQLWTIGKFIQFAIEKYSV